MYNINENYLVVDALENVSVSLACRLDLKDTFC